MLATKINMMLDIYLGNKILFNRETIDYLIAAEYISIDTYGTLILTSDGIAIINEILNTAGKLI
jgi:hypothetical protein